MKNSTWFSQFLLKSNKGSFKNDGTQKGEDGVSENVTISDFFQEGEGVF